MNVISYEMRRTADDIKAMGPEDRRILWGIEVQDDGTGLERDSDKKHRTVGDFVRVMLAEEINTPNL